MRNGILATLITLSVASSWSTAQVYYPQYPTPKAYYRPVVNYRPYHPTVPYYRPGYVQMPQRYYPQLPQYRPNPHYAVAPQYQPHPSPYQLPVVQPYVPAQAPQQPQGNVITKQPKAQPVASSLPDDQQLKDGGQPEFIPVPDGNEPIPEQTETTLPEGSGTKKGTPEIPSSPPLHGDHPADCQCPICCLPAAPIVAAPVATAPVVVAPAAAAPRFFANAGWLFWWNRGQRAPVLLNVGAPPAVSSVGGGQNLPFDSAQNQGIRSTVGMWLDPAQTWAVEATLTYLFQRSPFYSAASAGDPPLIRPYLETSTGLAAGDIVASPGAFSGRTEIETAHQLWSTEANLRLNLLRGSSWYVDALAGIRYLQLEERLNMDANSNDLTTGGSLFVSDQFSSRNKFFAGQIGLQGEVLFGRFFVNGFGKVALGNNRQVLNVGGLSAVSTPGAAQAFFGAGHLAQPSNSGRHVQNQFAVLPEFGVNVGVALTDALRVSIGYNFLYLTNVVRPGDHVPVAINTTQTTATPVGTPGPLFQFNDSSYWAQGINFTFEIRF